MKKNLLIIISTAMILTVSCNKGGNEKDTQIQGQNKTETQATKKDTGYIVINNDKDEGNITEERTLEVIVPDDASEEKLKELAKQIGKEFKDVNKLYVKMYGDRRFMSDSYTHGMIEYNLGEITNANYRAKNKADIPTVEEKDIYIDYMSTLHQNIQKGKPADKAQEEVIEEKTKKEIGKEYNKTIEEIEKIWNKVTAYKSF